MKYDDARWHSGGDFPKDLSADAAATHIGMFVAWALLSGLAGQLHMQEFPQNLDRLRARNIAPGAFLLLACDGQFTDEDLNDEGNAFASSYFEAQQQGFLSDYERALGSRLPSLYYVADTWENFDRLLPVLNDRLSDWRRQKN